MQQFKYLVKTLDGKPFTGEASWWEDKEDKAKWRLFETIQEKSSVYRKSRELRCYGHAIICKDDPYILPVKFIDGKLQK